MVLGAVAGAALGLLVIGYPPASVDVVGADVPDECWNPWQAEAGRVSDALNGPDARDAFVQAWRDAGGEGQAPRALVQPARCGPGLRVWGTPLLPDERSRWTTAVRELTTGPGLKDVTDALKTSEQQQQQALEAAWGTFAAAASSLSPDRSPAVDAEYAELITTQSLVTQALEGLRSTRSAQNYVDLLDQNGAVSAPATALFAIAVGTLLGGMIGLWLGVVGGYLIRNRAILRRPWSTP
jgi:hypothetical protein